MYSKIMTCVLQGLDGYKIEVESNIARGLNSFNIVGLPDTSINEAKERVRASIGNIGYKFPLGRITINLAPANLKKEGSQLDLAIAISILNANGIIINQPDNDTAFIGELALDGRILGVDGALPMIISLKELGFTKCILPYENKYECSLIDGIDIIPVKKLNQVIDYLNEDIKIEPLEIIKTNQNIDIEYNMDFDEIKGQENLKRAMEISAAGNHNLLMIGPPGSGKTMAAMRLPTIIPNLDIEKSIECTKIYSVTGNLSKNKLITVSPFRNPHHTSSSVALIGGGRIPKPGEISLAHNGTLFLDELPEFNKSTIEVLRQPLEEGYVTISRANATLTYPADFLLIAGMNPCPCGHYGDQNNDCTCTLPQIQKYLNKISKPILDRIDIHIEVEPVNFDDLTDDNKTESSKDIKKRVKQARNIQKNRFKNSNIIYNSQMSNKEIKKYIILDDELNNIIKLAFKKYKFSARSFNKILKLTRTIADLDNSEKIKKIHLLEAIRYKTIDKKYWN